MSVTSVEITCKGLFALLREDVEDLLFTKNRESRQAVSGRIIKRIRQINVVAEAEEIPRESAIVRDATQTVEDLRQGLQKLENVLLGQSLRRHNLRQTSAGIDFEFQLDFMYFLERKEGKYFQVIKDVFISDIEPKLIKQEW